MKKTGIIILILVLVGLYLSAGVDLLSVALLREGERLPIPVSTITLLILLFLCCLFWKRKRRLFSWLLGIAAFFPGLGVLFLTIGFLPEAGAYVPNQYVVVKKLEQYKKRHRHYPDSLESIGLDNQRYIQQALSHYHYELKDETFELCEHLKFGGADCFDPLTSQWNVDPAANGMFEAEESTNNGAAFK